MDAKMTEYIGYGKIDAGTRYSDETHIYPRRHFQALTDMSTIEEKDLASILKTVLVAFDRLFEVSFPYMMDRDETFSPKCLIRMTRRILKSLLLEGLARNSQGTKKGNRHVHFEFNQTTSH